MLDLFSSDPFQVLLNDSWRLFLLFRIGWMLSDSFELCCLQVVGVWWGLRSKSPMKVSVWLFFVFLLSAGCVTAIGFCGLGRLFGKCKENSTPCAN